MDIVIGNGIDDQSSNPEQGCLRFSLHQCSWESHEFIYFLLLHLSYG